MSFLIHEDKLWPIAIIVASGSFSLKQHEESLQQWNKWFARDETFYVMRVFLDNDAIQHSDEIGKSTIEWMKNGAAKNIKELVGAMVIVVPEEQYTEDKKISKIFGVPGGLFPSIDSAYTFLNNVPNTCDVIHTISQDDIDTVITDLMKLLLMNNLV